jgi:uncharacterized protein (TIGR03083 family)
MTAVVLQRSDAEPRAATFDHDTAMRLAAAEYARGAEVLCRLQPFQWRAQTVNDDWDVRAMVGHVVGMMQMMCSLPNLIGQQREALRAAKATGAPSSIDALPALQVRRNAHLSPAQLVAEWRAAAPRAVRGRRRLPSFLRRRPMPEAQVVGGTLESWTLGYLTDVVLTRDPFMHRLDLAEATGVGLEPTPEHEGLLVDDVVLEWAQRHGQPSTLELTGPVGGIWTTGAGTGVAERIRMDALEFCRVVSGRGPATGLLATAVPF